MIWEGPPTDKREQSRKVKDTGGRLLGKIKGLKGRKLQSCRKRISVQPVSNQGKGRRHSGRKFGRRLEGTAGRLRQKGLVMRGE